MPGSQIDHLSYTVNEWCRPPYTDFLSAVFADPSVKTFVDIGANVGGVTYALDHLGHIHKLDKVISFEPDSDNFEFLTKLCNDVGARTHTKFINHQIGIYYGKTEMRVCGAGDGNVGGYFLDDDAITSTRPFTVHPYDKVFQLSEIEKYFDDETIDFVKIDIEGAELNILEHSSLLKNCKYMMLEWHYTPEDFDKFFAQHLESSYDLMIADRRNNQYLLKHKN